MYKKKENSWGFEPRTSYASCSCLTTELLREVYALGQFALLKNKEIEKNDMKYNI